MSQLRSLWRARSRLVHHPGLALNWRTTATSTTIGISTGSLQGLRGYAAQVSEELSEHAGQFQSNHHPIGGAEPDFKYHRNLRFRHSFQAAAKLKPDDPELEKLLASPFVPPIRYYASSRATKQSIKEAHQAVKRLVALQSVWSMYLHSHHYQLVRLGWEDIYKRLTSMTPRDINRRPISAIKVIMPESQSLDIRTKNISFIESSTGATTKLRATPDPNTPNAFILRGWKSALGKVADELVTACRDVKIFELGDVANSDYQAKQLWPKIGHGVEDVAELPVQEMGTLWAHREETEWWIETRYEDISRPESEQWTPETFTTYIKAVACSRLHPNLILPLYGHLADERTHRPPTQRGRCAVDTEGIRVRLITSAFEDPTARSSITSAALKTALVFMSQAGGYRAAADKLFTFAEDQRLPLDTETFNIMLQGYAAKGDFRYFDKFLRKMRSRYFDADARTWLILLKFTQKPEQRERIIVSMFGFRLLEDDALRRGVATIMAAQEAYTAFSAGTTVKQFLRSRSRRYGESWVTREGLNDIIVEFLRCRSRVPFTEKKDELEELVQRLPDDGRPIEIDTMNTILHQAELAKNWRMALWVLNQLSQQGLTPNETTYQILIHLAIRKKCPRALGVIFFYACTERKMAHHSRSVMHNVLRGKLPQSFWQKTRPVLFDDAMMQVIGSMLTPGEHLSRGKAAQAIYQVCKKLIPDQPLADSVEAALKLDYALRDNDCSVADDITIRMVHPDGSQPPCSVTLKHAFMPSPSLPSDKISKKGDEDDTNLLTSLEPRPQSTPPAIDTSIKETTKYPDISPANL